VEEAEIVGEFGGGTGNRTPSDAEGSADIRGISVDVAGENYAEEVDKCAEGREPGDSLAKPASSRVVILHQLSGAMLHAAAAGDLEAARVAHRAIGELLGADAQSATVVDLAREREKQAGR